MTIYKIYYLNELNNTEFIFQTESLIIYILSLLLFVVSDYENDKKYSIYWNILSSITFVSQ